MCHMVLRMRSATMARHGWVAAVKRRSGGANDEMQPKGSQYSQAHVPNSSYSRELAGETNGVNLACVINVLPPSCRQCRHHAPLT
jgi:hypothetical protein